MRSKFVSKQNGTKRSLWASTIYISLALWAELPFFWQELLWGRRARPLCISQMHLWHCKKHRLDPRPSGPWSLPCSSFPVTCGASHWPWISALPSAKIEWKPSYWQGGNGHTPGPRGTTAPGSPAAHGFPNFTNKSCIQKIPQIFSLMSCAIHWQARKAWPGVIHEGVSTLRLAFKCKHPKMSDFWASTLSCDFWSDQHRIGVTQSKSVMISMHFRGEMAGLKWFVLIC